VQHISNNLVNTINCIHGHKTDSGVNASIFRTADPVILKDDGTDDGTVIRAKWTVAYGLGAQFTKNLMRGL